MIVGIVYLAISGAPAHYPWINGSALAIAVIAIIALEPVFSSRRNSVLAGFAIVLLGMTLLLGPSVEGVHRWLSLGPLNLHIGMLILPPLCLIVWRLPDHIAALVIAAVAVILALQPDAGTGTAWALGVMGLAISSGSIPLMVAGAFAFIAAGYSISQALIGAADLPAVAYVEGVFGDLFSTDILMFIPAAGFALWLTYRTASIAENEVEGRALQSFTYGLFISAIIGNYPTPFVGYGAAPILGYGLALGLLGIKRPAREYRYDDSDRYR